MIERTQACWPSVSPSRWRIGAAALAPRRWWSRASVGKPAAVTARAAKRLIEAKIMGLRGRLVVLSAGRDEGVRPGMRFHVIRGNQYLGEVLVGTVHADMSGAEITRPEGLHQIREGDEVWRFCSVQTRDK